MNAHVNFSQQYIQSCDAINLCGIPVLGDNYWKFDENVVAWTGQATNLQKQISQVNPKPLQNQLLLEGN